MNQTHRHAWAAGFLDGEGCFALLSGGPLVHETTKRPSISVSQKSREPLDVLAELFGGKVSKQRLSVDGTQIWQWRILKATEVVKVIDAIEPYLVLKLKQAQILRAFSSSPVGKGNKSPARSIDYRAKLIREMESVKGR